jgi:hypothetical protein
LSLCRESGVRVSSGTLDPISCCGSGWTLVRPIELTSVSTWASMSCRGRRSGAAFVRASQGALDGYSHKAVATPESDCSADLVCGSVVGVAAPYASPAGSRRWASRGRRL